MYHDGINYSHNYLYQNASNMRPCRWTGGGRGAVGLRNDVSSMGSLNQRRHGQYGNTGCGVFKQGIQN